MGINEPTLKLINPGLQCLLQDKGRFGVGHLGLSQGGAVDEHASNWANHLLDNPTTSPVIEIAMGLAEFEILRPATLAITGADGQAKVEGREISSHERKKHFFSTPGDEKMFAVKNWSSFQVKAGERLTFHGCRPGAGRYCYLAVKGGFYAEPKLGSVATVTRNQIGGLNGGALAQDDTLFCQRNEVAMGITREVPSQFIPDYSQPLELELIESYQSKLLPASVLQALYRQTFEVSARSDRMGIQLEKGKVQLPGDMTGIISEGIALGSVQIPASGQPFILMQDRQTLGGYPKLGCISRLSVSALAQRQPSSKITFKPIALGQAQEQWVAFNRFFNVEIPISRAP